MGSSPCREQSGEDPNAHADQSGKTEHAKIGRDLVDPRYIRQKSFQRIDSPKRKNQTGQTAGAAEQNAFDKQLSQNVTASGAQRSANTDFAVTRKRARKQQIGDVDAGYEQNAAGHRAKHEQSGMTAAKHRA